MDVLTFDVAVLRYGDWTTKTLGILINGTPLKELAREVELPHAKAEGNESLAGSYSPLTLADIRGDSQHFLGRPKASWFEDGDTVLLGCDCGEWGCWPLTTMVAVTPSLVVWSNFRHGHRTWDLSALGPFHFDRTAYESSLLSLQ